MIYDIKIASQVANYLLDKKAVILRPDEPFTWASGWRSPIYCDNRKLLSYPDARSFLKTSFAELIRVIYPSAEAVVGVATAGIAHAALIADEMNLPMAYARTQAKDHGTKSMIEGKLESGTKSVIVEDLISTGKSSLEVVRGVRDTGIEVLGMVAIFSYDFPIANKAAINENVNFYTLTDYNILLEVALDLGYINNNHLELLKDWRKSPDTWGR